MNWLDWERSKGKYKKNVALRKIKKKMKNVKSVNISNRNSTVALIRSATKDASKISDSEVKEMVQEAVQLAGGLSGIVKDGQLVVIKPNLVTTKATPGGFWRLLKTLRAGPYAEEGQVSQKVNGITVDWRVAKTIVELVRELNPSGKVFIMECSAFGTMDENFKRLGYTSQNIPGVDKFVGLDKTADGYRAIDSKDIVAIELKDKQLYEKLPEFLNNKYYFDKTYYSADVIISLASLKNHGMASITGGIKNVGIGCTPGKIYGNKRNIHRGLTIKHGWEPINNFIHDYYSIKPVDFVITDGLQGLAYGPHCGGAKSYEDAKMNMRLILASKDPVAVDTIQSCIIGVDAEKVNYLNDLSRDGYGTIDSSKITVVGNARVDEVKKQFPFSKGILSRKVRKTRYTDYEPPEISIENITVEDKKIIVNLKTAPKTTKVEVYIDGKLKATFTEGFSNLEFEMIDKVSDRLAEMSIYAFDRLLNCGYQVTQIQL